MSLIKHQKDFWAGVLYVTFGTAAIVIALAFGLGVVVASVVSAVAESQRRTGGPLRCRAGDRSPSWRRRSRPSRPGSAAHPAHG